MQLMSSIKDGDWIGSISAKVERDRRKGVTHVLIVQREGAGLKDAVLVPIDELVAIWIAQRDLSQQLIDTGRFGRKRKNHAMNGSSPTLWLHDESAPELRNLLWSWRGVSDLVGGSVASREVDDSLDDLSGIDYALLGSDGASRVPVVRSQVKRDPIVRRAVINRANGCCERAGCGATRDYVGFLDVHHILGVDVSDRVWTCVALCPNCHRDAHLSPQASSINEQLSEFAAQFGPEQSLKERRTRAQV